MFIKNRLIKNKNKKLVKGLKLGHTTCREMNTLDFASADSKTE